VNNLPPDSDSDEGIPLEQDLALSGGDPDALYEEEIRNMQRDSDIDKLSHRMTLLFILIPCLLCAVLAFAYLDVRDRLNQMQSTGSKEVEALSENVVEKVASLSEKYEALEKSLGQRLSILKDVSVAMQDALKESEKKIQELANSAVDKKTFEKAGKARSSEFTTALAALKENMAKQQGAIEGLSKKLQNELDREASAITAFESDLREQGERFAKTIIVIETLQKKALKLELDMKLLAEGTIDKKTWEKEKERTGRLEKKANDLAEEITWLEEKLKVTRERKPISQAETAGAKNEKTDMPATGTAASGAGKIIEQEIKE